MTTTRELADRLVALCRERRFVVAIEELYAADARQFENGTALPADRQGLVRACQEWLDSRVLHEMEILGVHVGTDAFVVEFRYDVTPHVTKERSSWCEAGVYRVSNGKIAEVRFYYKRLSGEVHYGATTRGIGVPEPTLSLPTTACKSCGMRASDPLTRAARSVRGSPCP